MKPIDEKEFNAAAKEPVKEQIKEQPKVQPKEVETSLLSPDIKIKSDSGEVIVDLEKFIKFGTIKKSIKIADMEIIMRTLTSDDKDEAVSMVATAPDESVMDYLKKVKYPILAYSIVKIDSVEFTSKENRVMLTDYLHKAQGFLIDLLWAEYEKINDEQTELLTNEELKKN